MANLDEALKILLKDEGRDTNDHNDSGGLTRFGIAQNKHPDIDVKNLTLEDATKIYRKQYWEPLQCDLINDQEIANKLFDTSAPCGIEPVSKAIQQAAEKVSGHTIVIDGIIGPKTVELINHCDPSTLLAEFRRLMKIHMKILLLSIPMMQNI